MSHYALSGSVPLRKGDTIEIEGIRGNIARVGHLFTEVHTVDGKVHYIPNVIFLRKASSSYTRDSLMKVMVSIKISGDADISSAEEIIKKIVEDNKDITSPPEPEVVVSDFREEYTEFAVKFHVTNPNKSDFVASELRKIIRTELKKAGIKLA
jgi:small-conductance mechanosensitive channel